MICVGLRNYNTDLMMRSVLKSEDAGKSSKADTNQKNESNLNHDFISKKNQTSSVGVRLTKH